MVQLGYARVSTTQQTLDQQLDALAEAGVDLEQVYSDKMSGVRDDRPGLEALMAYAREGDSITVVALDRLGRSLSHIVRTIDELETAGIALRSLREGIDCSTPAGRMVAHIFGSLAEYERTLINERAAAAREAARKRGRQTGRPPALTAEQVKLVRRMRDNGEPVATIADLFQVSRATVYRYTADEADAA